MAKSQVISTLQASSLRASCTSTLQISWLQQLEGLTRRGDCFYPHLCIKWNS